MGILIPEHSKWVNNLYLPGIENEIIQEFASWGFPLMDTGRGIAYGAGHAAAVVQNAFGVAANAPLLIDRKMVVAEAFAHDVGYSGLFGEDSSTSPGYIEVMDKKVAHMERGAELTRRFLEENQKLRPFFSNEEREKIVRAVRIHDDLTAVTSLSVEANPEIFALVIGDTLAPLDTSWVEPTFKGEEALRYLDNSRRKRLPLIPNSWNYALERYEALACSFEDFVRNRDLST